MTNTLTPVAFNQFGRSEFKEWFGRICSDGFIVTNSLADQYFETISNFEDGEEVAHIEVSRFDTASHNPELFIVTSDMVEYA